METLTQEVTEEGLRLTIPPEQLESLGWKIGQNVQISFAEGSITITRPPQLEDLIFKRAHRHLMCKVGDATATGPVEKQGKGWRVPVYLSYKDVYLGELLFNAQGDLLLDKSTSYEEMLARADAS